MPIQKLILVKYSELLGVDRRSAFDYFEQVRRASGVVPLNAFATINNTLASGFSASIHEELEAELLSDSMRRRLRRHRLQGRHQFTVFTRAGALLTLKVLLATRRDDIPYRPTAAGACALHANDYLESANPALSSGLLPVVTEFAPTWDHSNPRDLGPILRRAHHLYSLLLADGKIRNLIRNELAIEAEEVTFAGLPFSQFFPLLFGLHAIAKRGVRECHTSIITTDELAKAASISTDALAIFLDAKAQNLEEARAQLGPITSREEFATCVESPNWTTDILCFRKKPLLRLDDSRYLVLDQHFLLENASLGLSWNFVETFKNARTRSTFLGYWGNLFERYCQQLLTHYMPHRTHNNIAYPGGDIDILAHEQPTTMVFEIKAGFLPQEEKCARDQAALAAALNKKYLVDAKGQPKGVRQLASSVRALRDGRIPGANVTGKIYPILVAEDPIVQTFAMNAYLNDLFANELEPCNEVAPLTTLLIDELEEILPHIAASAITWRDILDSRAMDGKVLAEPMHTTFADIQRERHLPEQQDTFLGTHGDHLITLIDNAYGLQR